MNKFLKFSPTHAILYRDKKILVQYINDGEFATEQDWYEQNGMVGSFSIDEENKDLPNEEVWVLDRQEEFVSYKNADSPIKLIKICSKCQSDHVVRNGKNRYGFGRWLCKECNFSGTGNKEGRPMVGDRPMTNAERQKRWRENKH